MPEIPLTAQTVLWLIALALFTAGMVLMMFVFGMTAGPRPVRIAGAAITAAGALLVLTGPWYLNIAFLTIGLGLLTFADTIAPGAPAKAARQ